MYHLAFDLNFPVPSKLHDAFEGVKNKYYYSAKNIINYIA